MKKGTGEGLTIASEEAPDEMIVGKLTHQWLLHNRVEVQIYKPRQH